MLKRLAQQLSKVQGRVHLLLPGAGVAFNTGELPDGLATGEVVLLSQNTPRPSSLMPVL